MNTTKDAVGSKQNGAEVKMLSDSRDLIVMMAIKVTGQDNDMSIGVS